MDLKEAVIKTIQENYIISMSMESVPAEPLDQKITQEELVKRGYWRLIVNLQLTEDMK
ncbi:MAG: hypothetical protein PHI12_08715 [Dehalococcoidales bacterium]|nr:hypothetical protein [Dehalococcoidales bacterium]